MKKWLVFLCAIPAFFPAHAQWVGLFGTTGKSGFTGISKMGGKGWGTALGYNRGFSTAAGYNRFVSSHAENVSAGRRHYRLTENYFKFQVGAGYGNSLNEYERGEIQPFGSILWGFLSGSDKLQVYHEYPDGTITYGMDQNTGVYKAVRSLSQVFSVQLGAYFKIPVGVYVSIDYVKPKKRDLFEFRDEMAQKYAYMAVYGGTGKEYFAQNNTSGLYFSLGLRVGVN